MVGPGDGQMPMSSTESIVKTSQKGVKHLGLGLKKRRDSLSQQDEVTGTWLLVNKWSVFDAVIGRVSLGGLGLKAPLRGRLFLSSCVIATSADSPWPWLTGLLVKTWTGQSTGTWPGPIWGI